MSRRNRPATPLALTFGAFATALFLTLTGCQQESGPISAETSGYQAADESSTESPNRASTPSPRESSSGLRESDIDGVSPSTLPPTQPPTQAQQQQLMAQQSGGFELPEELAEAPEGDDAALLDYYERLITYQAPITSQAEAVEALQVLLPLRAEIAGRVLELEGLSAEQRREALEVRLKALQTTALFFGEGQEDLDALVDSLVNSDDPQLAARGQLALFQQTVSNLLSQDSGDVQGALDELAELVADLEPNAINFNALATTPDFLREAGYGEASEQATDLIGNAFAASTYPEVANVALDMLIMNDLPRLMETGGPAAAQRLLELTPRMLSGEELTSDQLEFASNVAQALEITGYLDMSRELFLAADEARAQHPEADPDGSFATSLAQSLERIEVTRAMIGQPLELEGVLADGGEFDWSQYRGQVVLVDFWATDCQPCLMEIPTIVQLYDKHHADGFDVVGINVDENTARVDQFLDQIELPWATVLAASPEQAGLLTNPNAVRYQVDALPYTLLVDREGNVAMVHARGVRMAEEIERLLAQGAPAESAEEPQEEAAQNPDATSLRRSSASAAPFVAFTETEGEEPGDTATAGELGSDDPPAEHATDIATEDDQPIDGELDVFDNTINPYLPPEGLSRIELLEFILDMRDRPHTIQARPGFSAGLVAACDQLLDLNPSGRSFTLATSTRLTYLHRQACRGDEAAQNRLLELAAQLAENMPENASEELAQQVELYRIEGRALAVDSLPADKIAPLLAELEAYMQQCELREEHLRLASQTVHAINLLPEEEREEYFQGFGKIWAESPEPELARYGKRIGRVPAASAVASQVGQTLEGAGVTLAGTALDLADDYRGKVLLVDFWATWCGPCRAELPNVEAAYQELHPLGLEIVGISIDESMPDLVAYLEENPLPWPTLAGAETQAIAERYGINAIPTMMLVDREGKIVAVAHGIEPLREQIATLLQGDDGETETP